MKHYLPVVCAVFAVRMALAQDVQGNGPAPPPTFGPQNVQVDSGGTCKLVRPGDIVHYELTIQSVGYARAVYADLQMRPGRVQATNFSELPLPDFRNMGGGGLAQKDAQSPDVYHFQFTVPPSTISGKYHGMGVFVSVSDGNEIPGRPRGMEVTRHTREQIYKYCLNVVSPLGGDGRPLVTNFKPGVIEKIK